MGSGNPNSCRMAFRILSIRTRVWPRYGVNERGGFDPTARVRRREQVVAGGVDDRGTAVGPDVDVLQDVIGVESAPSVGKRTVY
jgi:hypothetical protein